MRIPFTCAFIELLASYDKANYASYLLNFFPARYKACSSMWKFSQPSRKKLRYVLNITAIYNKMLRNIFIYVKSKIYSLWTFMFRKSKMPEIRLNCLVVPNNISVGDITH